ncbi:MAG: hypothetical protein ACLQVI_34175, partial [Polyangiaceae bacterium]
METSTQPREAALPAQSAQRAETAEPANALRAEDWTALERSGLVARLTQPEQESLRAAFEVVVVAAGETIVREGEPVEPLRVLVGGTARYRYGDSIWRLVRGGEAYGLPIADVRSPRSAETLTAARILLLPTRTLEELTVKHPLIRSHLLEGAVVNVLFELNLKVQDVQQRHLARRGGGALPVGRVDAGA